MLKMEGREGEEYARISAPNHIGILWIVGSEIEVKLLTTVWLGATAEDNHTHTEEKRGSALHAKEDTNPNRTTTAAQAKP